MALLNRIAISNGNKARKRAANLLITNKDGHTVVIWNKQLETEIQKRRAGKSALASRLSRKSRNIMASPAPTLTLYHKIRKEVITREIANLCSQPVGKSKSSVSCQPDF